MEAKSFLEKLNMPVKSLWENYRVFLLIFGIIILIIKFRDVFAQILVFLAKRSLENTEKQDIQLKSEQNQANSQANELIKEANDLSNNKHKVDEDWYKK